MAYDPIPTLDVKVGEERAWTVDSEAVETLARIVEVLERIEQQLALMTGVDLNVGEKPN